MSITITVSVVVMLLLFFSCDGHKKAMGEAILERDSLPMMNTLGVTTYVSDSGVTRYRVDTEEWLVYDRKTPSYWAFEKGVYLEQFDSLFSVEASIKADTAYFYDRKKLWKLIGNVDIKNRKGEHFNTELLYWNQATKKVYTDRFIRIQQPDRIIHAYGFESDEQLVKYVAHNIDGIFEVGDDQREKSEDGIISQVPDSLNNDSLK